MGWHALLLAGRHHELLRALRLAEHLLLWRHHWRVGIGRRLLLLLLQIDHLQAVGRGPIGSHPAHSWRSLDRTLRRSSRHWHPWLSRLWWRSSPAVEHVLKRDLRLCRVRTVLTRHELRLIWLHWRLRGDTCWQRSPRTDHLLLLLVGRMLRCLSTRARLLLLLILILLLLALHLEPLEVLQLLRSPRNLSECWMRLAGPGRSHHAWTSRNNGRSGLLW